MLVDPTIRIGDIVPVLGYLAGGVIFVMSLRTNIKLMAKDIKMLGKDVEAHSVRIEALQQVVTAQALQDQRIVMLESRLEELRHGDGWITGRRRGIEGEYTG